MHRAVKIFSKDISLTSRLSEEQRATGRAKKIPQEKFDISGIVVNFFAKFTVLTEEASGHIFLQILLQCLVAFKNYIYLNLNVHFSK